MEEKCRNEEETLKYGEKFILQIRSSLSKNSIVWNLFVAWQCNTFEMLDIGIFWKSCVDIVILLSPGLHLHELKSKESCPIFKILFWQGGRYWPVMGGCFLLWSPISRALINILHVLHVLLSLYVLYVVLSLTYCARVPWSAPRVAAGLTPGGTC